MGSRSKDLHSGIFIKILIHTVALCTLFVTAGCGGGGGGSSSDEPQSPPQGSQPMSQLPTPPQGSQSMQPIVSGAPVCPADVSAVSQDGLAVTVNFDPPSIDNLGRQVTAVCSPSPGSLFEVGTHEVMCERLDDPSAQCTFSITVLANTDPIGGGICDRTLQVRNAIVDRIPGVDTCSAVTDAHLAAVTGLLNLGNTGISSLQSGDFSGLTSLRSLLLNRNQLITLPADIFNGLVSLETLRLVSNELQSLPKNVFAGLVGAASRFRCGADACDRDWTSS